MNPDKTDIWHPTDPGQNGHSPFRGCPMSGRGARLVKASGLICLTWQPNGHATLRAVRR